MMLFFISILNFNNDFDLNFMCENGRGSDVLQFTLQGFFVIHFLFIYFFVVESCNPNTLVKNKQMVKLCGFYFKENRNKTFTSIVCKVLKLHERLCTSNYYRDDITLHYISKKKKSLRNDFRT